MEDNVDLDIHKIILKYPENVEGKILIAKNVLLHLFVTMDKSTPIHDVLLEVHNLTGVDYPTLKAVYDNLPMVKTFSGWFREKSLQKIRSFCASFENLRKIITRMYVEDLTIVTADKLVYTLKQIYSNYEEDKLRNDFKQHGFTWKRLPGTNKSIVVEKTDQFMDRMAYLTKVRRYRQQRRYFVYLYADRCVAASSFSGLINVNLVKKGSKDSKLCDFVCWLVNILILFLPANCVLVAATSARGHITVAPNYSSSKTDICKWLEENNISYDSQSPKAELFTLVKKFKRSCAKEKCHIEKIVNGYGHEILWFPTDLPALDYFSRIEIDFNELTNASKNVLKELTLDNWSDYEKDLINEENKIYEEDLKVETIQDKLLTLAKYGELSVSDLDECDTALSDDEYISNLIQ